MHGMQQNLTLDKSDPTVLCSWLDASFDKISSERIALKLSYAKYHGAPNEESCGLADDDKRDQKFAAAFVLQQDQFVPDSATTELLKNLGDNPFKSRRSINK